ncbi:retrovirus-related pol polyprotein from transposon TNT 1-94 [Tanacetum coccineum]|uniref:Retrovirus-related pol polyprotein from transposon TNT 1-94 n=1 Tax=Tanacetum coccineum TaxID=301880 RepID=A0ABQ5FZE5_9ASTR
MKDKVVPNTCQVKFKKTKVKDHHRISSISNQSKAVTACNDSLKSRTSNVNVVCGTCGKCVFNSNHDACVYKFLNDVNARTKKPNIVPISSRKPKRQANKPVATPYKKTVISDPTITNSKSYYRMLYEKTSKAWKWWIAQQCPSGYKWVPKTKMKWDPICHVFHRPLILLHIVQLILFIVDSGCTKHMTGNISILCNFIEKYLGTICFGNDQFAPILGYGDLVQGNITINRVYYVEGLNYNLFSVGQFCDADLEVAFRKSTCFVRDLQGNDLLTGNRGSNLYTISLQETTSSTLICLMAKASLTQAWLWHRRLSHLNFDYINLLSKKDVVIGLPKLKYVKDQLCSYCEVSKAKMSSFKKKTVPSSKGRSNLLHMDLCGPMLVASINGKKYILIKEMLETSVANDTSGLVPRQKAPDYDNYKMFLLQQIQSSYPTDNSAQQDTLPSMNIHPTIEPSIPTHVNAEENNNDQAEFTNPFYSEYRWTKDHPLTLVRRNPSMSIVEPKTIKEAMADSAWIEVMQEELHPFDRLQVWELVDKPFGKNVIKLKWRRFMLINQMVVEFPDQSRKGLPSKESSIWIKTSSKSLLFQMQTMGCIDTAQSTLKNTEFLGYKVIVCLDVKEAGLTPVQSTSILDIISSRNRFQYLSAPTLDMRCLTPAELEDSYKDGDGDASFQLKSDSLPHTHTQTTKTYYKHQDSRIKKAQVLKTKTSATSDKQDLSLRYQVYQGRLLASFQKDAKYEHVGQDTRSQGGKDDQD